MSALDLGTLVQYVDLDPKAFDRKYAAVDSAIQRLQRSGPDVPVGADTSVADAALAGVESTLRGLPDGDVTVEADTEGAEAEIRDLGNIAEDELGQAGEDAGEGMGAGIIAALAAVPFAGAVVGIGALIGKSILDGLGKEVREDRLAAVTGLDPASVKRIATAAGEAYASNFGESIEANFDVARAAVQSGLLDPEATARDSQRVIEQLSGVADILGEDIPRVARAVGVLLKSGMAADADAAFDILVKGQQAGVNLAEDMLDTFTEYPAVLQRLGLSSSDSLGLLSQGLKAGARDSDFVADALKEFQIRATDASEASARGYELIGLSAEDMTAKIAAGGAGAREGLDEVLDGLRAIEDPVKRNEAAVALFGTKAEDLGDSLFALDLDKVAEDLGKVEGAAAGAIDTLYDNTAGDLESAKRNIQVAADGVKGALASAFAPDIQSGAAYVQENRAAVIGFLFDVVNGALDAGRALVEGAAAGVEGFGEFISDTGPAVIGVLRGVVAGLDAIPGVDLSDAVEGLDRASLTLQGLGPGSATAADAMRENLIYNGIDQVQAKLNEVRIPAETQAAFHDATVRLSNDVAEIGYKSDGTKLAVEAMGTGFDLTTEAGKKLDDQIRAAVASLEANAEAGKVAGQSTEELTADYAANRESLIRQIESMGISRDRAIQLADRYGAVPNLVETRFSTPGLADAIRAATGLATTLRGIDGSVTRATIRVDEKLGTTVQRGGLAGRAFEGTRALGGPVMAGVPYLVGEHGPEIHAPVGSGYIIDAERTRQILNGSAPEHAAAPAPTEPIYITVQSVLDNRVVAESTVKYLAGRRD